MSRIYGRYNYDTLMVQLVEIGAFSDLYPYSSQEVRDILDYLFLTLYRGVRNKSITETGKFFEISRIGSKICIKTYKKHRITIFKSFDSLEYLDFLISCLETVAQVYPCLELEKAHFSNEYFLVFNNVQD